MHQIPHRPTKTQTALQKISSLVSFEDSPHIIGVPRFGSFISRPLTSYRATKLNVNYEDTGMPLNSQHSTTLNSQSQLNSERFFFKKSEVVIPKMSSKRPSEINNLFLQWEKEDFESISKAKQVDKSAQVFHISPSRQKSFKVIPQRQSVQIKPSLLAQQSQLHQLTQWSQKRKSTYIAPGSLLSFRGSKITSPFKIIQKIPQHVLMEMERYHVDEDSMEVKQRDVNFVSKKLQIDPLELKIMYDEIMAANNKIDMHVKDNVNFFNNLFNDGQFEHWLQVDKHILSQKELDYTVETLQLKQELIEQRMKIDVVDFEVLDSVLSKLSFFERFTKSTRINILKLATYMKVDPGEYIFYQGDYGDNLYVILKGSITVKIDRDFNEEGQESIKQTVTSLYDGQQFGELAMMETKQKDEEVVLEEKLQGLNITSMSEVKKKLYGQINSKNKTFQEISHTDQQPEKVHQNMRQFTVGINNQDPSGQPNSNISYKQSKNNSHQQRQASIQASETCHLITMGRDNFRNILMVLMQDELEVKIKMLRSLRFFQDVQPFVLIPLANQLLQCLYGLDHVIVREKEPLDQMYIIFKGSCNVIRQITTQRQVIPSNTSKGSIKALPNFVFGDQKLDLKELRMFHSEKIDHFETKMNEEAIDKIGDNTLLMQDGKQVTYQQTYVYRKLQQGDLIFGRALTGQTLEGLKGQDHARMTIVSSSHNTILYSISQKQLSYCPDFLKNHLINYLITVQDYDAIQPQPINKEVNRLHKLVTKPQNQSEAEKEVIKQQLQKQKQQQNLKVQIHSQAPVVKIQKEIKQDVRNHDWEVYKQKLNVQSIQHQSKERDLDDFKKY